MLNLYSIKNKSHIQRPKIFSIFDQEYNWDIATSKKSTGQVRIDGTFSPRDSIERSLRLWWLVAVLTIFGGLLGFGAAYLRPPIYEAQIVFTFSIDFSRTGVLSDIEEDQAMETAGDVLGSTAVMNSTLQRAAEQGVRLSLEELTQAAVRERTSNTWIVRIRHTDPHKAQLIANAWGQAASQVFSDALGHTIVVEGLARYLDALEGCLKASSAVEPVQATCQYQNLSDILGKIAETGPALKQARLDSLGMFPGLNYLWSEQASLPQQPVLYRRGQFVLIGALAAFLIALAIIQGGIQRLLTQGHLHD